jgi:SAM-dependent methyltransferase
MPLTEKSLGVNINRAAYWDSVARAWQATRPQDLWRAHSDRINTALLEAWLPRTGQPAARALKTDSFDEAFGTGLYPCLAVRAQSVVNMDVSRVALHAARARHRQLRAAGADTCSLPFADAAFDIVVSNSTLDHLNRYDEVAASVRELHRVLKCDGQLIITLDNAANPAIALRNALPRPWRDRLGVVPYQVGVTLDQHRLVKVLQTSGFHVGAVRFLMHHPSVIAPALLRLIERAAPPALHQRSLDWLDKLERLGEWPTRAHTGHFVAVRATKTGA